MQISTYSIISIIISLLFPYLWTSCAKFTGNGYNNSTTRDFVDELVGKRRRAYYAHINALEAFPIFLVAVLIANMNQVNLSIIHCLISINLVCRTLYGLFYIYDFPNSRSLVWFFALACNLALLVLSI